MKASLIALLASIALAVVVITSILGSLLIRPPTALKISQSPAVSQPSEAARAGSFSNGQTNNKATDTSAGVADIKAPSDFSQAKQELAASSASSPARNLVPAQSNPAQSAGTTTTVAAIPQSYSLAPVAMNSFAPAPNETLIVAPPHAQIPAALASQNPDLHLSPQQQAVADSLVEKFVNDIGGPYANPNGQNYPANWKQAQSDSDELYKLFFGSEAYVQQNIRAAEEAQANGARIIDVANQR